MRANLSIRSKLLIVLLLTGLACLGAGGVLGYRTGYQALHTSVIRRLEGEQTVKQLRVEAYLANVRRFASEIGGSQLAADATVALTGAFDAVQDGPTSADAASLRDWYREHYLPALDLVSGGHAPLEGLLPEDAGPQALQAAFVAGRRASPTAIPSGPAAASLTAYAAARARFDSELTREADTARFDDLLLVDAANGNVVYTARGNPDFATNLMHGPYMRSGAALAFDAALDPRNGGRVVLQDFTAYPPARLAPEMFAAVPITSGGRIVGVFLAEIGVQTLDALLTDKHDWRKAGQGETGEVIMVGADRLFRSQSRFLIQDPTSFFRDLRGNGVPAATVDQIRALGSTVLLLRTNTVAIQDSFRDHGGTAQFRDYRGAQVITAFGQVHDPDVQWAIESKQDVSEAFAPLVRFQRNLLLAAAVASILLTALALIWSGMFTRPLRRVLAGMVALRQGGRADRVAVVGHDEFADLARGFNGMADTIADRDAQLARQKTRRLALLRSFYPDGMANRLGAGDDEAGDGIPDAATTETVANATVVVAWVDGLDALALHLTAAETLLRFSSVLEALAEAAAAEGIEPIRSFGESWIAVSGLSAPRLDHARRALAFAIAAVRAVERIGQDWEHPVSLHVGLCSGEIAVGMVGRPRAAYDLWGRTVTFARRIALETEPGCIRVADTTLDLLPDTTGFVPCPPITLPPGITLATWTRPALLPLAAPAASAPPASTPPASVPPASAPMDASAP